jgi:hypothetical protein
MGPGDRTNGRYTHHELRFTKPEDGASNNTWGAKLNTTSTRSTGSSRRTPTRSPIASPTFTGVQTGPDYLANGANANGLGYSHTRAGKVGYDLYNNGGVTAWAMYQPAHATGDEWRLAALNGGGVVDVFIVDLAGAATFKGTNAGLTVTDRDGAGSWTIYDQSDILRFWNGSDRFSLDGSGNVVFNGATVSANITRFGAGPHLYHVNAAFGSGRVYVTAAGAA